MSNISFIIRRQNGEDIPTDLPPSTQVSDLLTLLDEPNGKIIYAGSILTPDSQLGEIGIGGVTTLNLIPSQSKIVPANAHILQNLFTPCPYTMVKSIYDYFYSYINPSFAGKGLVFS